MSRTLLQIVLCAALLGCESADPVLQDARPPTSDSRRDAGRLDTAGPDAPLLDEGGAPTDADAPPADAAGPDHGQPPSPCANVGKPCTKKNALAVCGKNGAFCLLRSEVKTAVSQGYVVANDEGGVCSCSCASGTCFGGGRFCSFLGMVSGGIKHVCLQGCSPKLGANDCAPGVACGPHTSEVLQMFGKAFCFFAGCQAAADCPVRTGTFCKLSANSCPTGQTCFPFIGPDTGVCALPGTCDAKSGLCGKNPPGLFNPKAKIGDPCSGDADCDGEASCQLEWDPKQLLKKPGEQCKDHAECCNGYCVSGKCGDLPCPVQARNGYCIKWGCLFASTFPALGCGKGADCVLSYQGGCAKTCDVTDAKTCRGHPKDQYGDYECRAYNMINATKQPVCDFGSWASCNKFTCTMLGDTANSTMMVCRGLDGKIKTSGNDPAGFCLDTTASGAVKP